MSVSVMSWSVPSYRVSYDETIESIWNGEVHPSEIPRISVFDLDGRLYSINNRRLFVWRVLACKGKVKDVRPMMTWHQFRDTPQARQAMVQWSFPVHMELAEQVVCPKSHAPVVAERRRESSVAAFGVSSSIAGL